MLVLATLIQSAFAGECTYTPVLREEGETPLISANRDHLLITSYEHNEGFGLYTTTVRTDEVAVTNIFDAPLTFSISVTDDVPGPAGFVMLDNGTNTQETITTGVSPGDSRVRTVAYQAPHEDPPGEGATVRCVSGTLIIEASTFRGELVHRREIGITALVYDINPPDDAG